MTTYYKKLIFSLALIVVGSSNAMKPAQKDYFFATIKAIKEGNNVLAIKNITQDPGLVKRQDDAGSTLLSYAAQNGNTELTKLLVQNGADVNARDKKSNTPLAKALTAPRKKEGHNEVIQFLTKSGGLVYAKITVMLEPSFGYRLNAYMRYSRAKYNFLPADIRKIVRPVQEEDLHMSLAYIALPIKYSLAEGASYTDQVKRFVENTNQELSKLNLNEKLFELRNSFKTKVLEVLGSFIVVTYSAPAELNALVDKIYTTLFTLFPNAVKVYSEELKDFHISIAQLSPGEKFDPTMKLPQTVLERFKLDDILLGDNPTDSVIKSGARIPSQFATEKFIECSGEPVECKSR